MKAKTDQGTAKPQTKFIPINPRVDKLIDDLDALIKSEKKLVFKMFLKKLKRNLSLNQATILISSLLSSQASVKLQKQKKIKSG